MIFLPKIAITMGDPAGIGPEVAVAALKRAQPWDFSPLLIGDPEVFQRAAKAVRAPWAFPVMERPGDPTAPGQVPVLPVATRRLSVRPGRWSRATGEASLAAVSRAVELALTREVDALVTAPICKQAWQAAGARVPGHTELLARLTRTEDPVMMFVGGPFRLVLMTIHVPLARVPGSLSTAGIARTVRTAVDELRRRFGIRRPRVAVAGLNPHAGEGGLFGTEEKKLITPAVKILARNPDLTVQGPLAPDTLFEAAARGAWDLVACMYHDQGLIPFKLLALHSGVNVTAGLPIIRTSPDHGTAFDLAGTGRANPGSMLAAIRTAVEMARSERRNQGGH